MSNSFYDAKGIGGLDPETFATFQRGRFNARNQYDLASAQNKFRQNQVNLGYTQSKGDLQTDYGKARRAFGSDWNRRGMLNSGLYKQAYGDLQKDRMRGLARLQFNRQSELDALDLAGRQLVTVRDNTLADVDTAEAARRQAVAAALRYAQGN